MIHLAVVETRMESSFWTALFTAVTPLCILFSLWVQRIWAKKGLKSADKAAKAAEEVKTTLASSDANLRDSLHVIKKTTDKTNMLVNGQRAILLRNLAALARTYANMANANARRTGDEVDKKIAADAEVYAVDCEKESYQHEQKMLALNQSFQE